MEKLQKKLAFSALLFVISGAGVVLLARTQIPRSLRLLRWAYETGFGVRRILRSSPTVLLGIVFLLLVLTAVFTGFRCVGLFLKIARLSARAPAPDPPVADRGDGMEKYLRQLDEQLKSGLIDRAEYKVLREKYERMGK